MESAVVDSKTEQVTSSDSLEITMPDSDTAERSVDSRASFQPISLADDRGALSDDADQGMDFRRTKLKVNPAELAVGDGDDLDLSINGTERDEVNGSDTFRNVILTRDRPFGASTVSRGSRASTKSKVSLSPHIRTSDIQAKNLFCYRTNAIEKAVEDCKSNVLVKSMDGDIKAYWLLTEIDHWDLEKERLVILTTQSLLIIKYDFIALRATSCKRVQLNVVSFIEVGDFVYPRYSIMPSREHGGLRVHWSLAAPTATQMWNPLCDDIGYITLSHHLLAYNEKEKETVTFDVADLVDSIVQAVNEVRRSERRTEQLRIENRPITIYSYASAASLVFNQSHIGFHMERGGVSF